MRDADLDLLPGEGIFSALRAFYAEAISQNSMALQLLVERAVAVAEEHDQGPNADGGSEGELEKA